MNENRVSALRAALPPRSAALISSQPNRSYLSGLDTGDAGLILVTPTDAVFYLDSRYTEIAEKTVTSCRIVQPHNVLSEIAELLKSEGVKTIYPETEAVSLEQFARWRESFGKLLSTENFLSPYLSHARQIKSADEIEKMQKAQEIADAGFSYILDCIRPGRTEREIALDLEFFCRRNGSEGVSFDFIVVSGENSSLPHGVPSSREIRNGDFVTMDFGCVVDGYRSDMTRTVAVGTVSEEQRAVYDTVLKAQLAVLDAVRPGCVCREIDKISRDIIDPLYPGCFGHGLGHGVGLEIHESPAFNTRDTSLLVPGMVLTDEPGIYLPGKFGVRIEDMILITDDGCRNFAKSPKELIVL